MSGRLLSPAEYAQRLRGLRLLVTDVDGVLTDGGIVYLEGSSEAKVFSVRDGSAVYIARLIDLPVAVLTARRSEAVQRRFSELPVLELRQGVFDKLGACRQLQRRVGADDATTAYIGDDLVDLPLLRRVGVAITPADAHAQARAVAHRVTRARGGQGALREIVDDIVQARGLWQRVLADYEDRQGRP